MQHVSNEKIISFTQLNAWKYGHQLVLKIYKRTKTFPKNEMYSLCDQIQRAAVSVVSNIAEGFGRDSLKEKVQFYTISRGSIAEIQSQLLVARDLHYLNKDDFQDLANLTITTQKLLNGLIKQTKSRLQK